MSKEIYHYILLYFGKYKRKRSKNIDFCRMNGTIKFELLSFGISTANHSNFALKMHILLQDELSFKA